MKSSTAKIKRQTLEWIKNMTQLHASYKKAHVKYNDTGR